MAKRKPGHQVAANVLIDDSPAERVFENLKFRDINRIEKLSAKPSDLADIILRLSFPVG